MDNIKKLAYACGQLQQGKQPAHPLLAAFRHWGELLEHIKEDPTADLDLALTVRLIESFSVDKVVRAVDSCVPEASADVVISTAHKAKGLEWSSVRIGSDFPEPRDKKTGVQLPVPAALAQLAYVAVTRAKDQLDLGGLAWIHDRPEVQTAMPVPSPEHVTSRPKVAPHPTPLTEAEVSARLDAVAAKLTPEDIAVMHAGLRTLVENDKGNGPGFREMDSALGHQLAELPQLTPKQAAVAVVICQRHKRQLGETGERARQIVREVTTPDDEPATLPPPASGPELGAA